MTTTEHTLTGRARPLDALRVVLGAVVLVLGVAILVSPGATLFVVALLFGIQLLVSGLVRLVLATRGDAVGGRRVLAIVLSALTVLAGVVCVLQPGTSLLILLWTIALGWLSDGVSELAAGAARGRPPLQRTTLIVFGIASVVAAVLLLAFPGTSLVLLTRLGGAALVVLGVLTLATAVRPRR